MKNVNEFFVALSKALGTTLEPDADGAVMMTMQGRPCMLRHTEDDDFFVFYSELGFPCGFGTENLYRRLLSANFLFAETFSGSIGLDPSGKVGISFIIPLLGDTEQFVSDVRSRAIAANDWTERLAQLNADEETAASKRQEAIPSGSTAASSVPAASTEDPGYRPDLFLYV